MQRRLGYDDVDIGEALPAAIVYVVLAVAQRLPGKTVAPEQGFPDREIVFEMASREGELGFIHPDGTDLVTRTIDADGWIGFPTWSPDGDYIAYRTEAIAASSYFSPQRAGVVSKSGEKLGECREWEWDFGRVWMTNEHQLLMPVHLAEENNRGRVILADVHSCATLSTLYQAANDDDSEIIDNATLSSQGWLAISRLLFQTDKPTLAEILVLAPDANIERVVGHGLAPAWSRDGEWLVYTALDGIYIVRKDGTQMRRVVDIDATTNRETLLPWSDGLSIASWSPDGKWLVYDRLTPDGRGIFKVDLSSGEESLIFMGGIYPHWRWDSHFSNDALAQP